ncbi:phosphodiester glycosidase family protein, partial [Klebsiella pneumoniae]
LNEDKGWGNFFLQPNGVLAWNDKQAVILTTEQYKAKVFQPDYATQSGPMLVINGKINPLFLANSDSKKIRNGVGVKNNKLYFVISKNRVNFYS